MSRSTAEIAAQGVAVLPPWALPLAPVIGGLAAELALVESTGADFANSSTVGGAGGIWLTLLAHGYGVDRATGEADASLQIRLRAPEDQATRPAILAAVNAALAPYTADEATMLEFWDDGFADIDAWADRSVLCDRYNSFVLLLPLVGTALFGGTFADVDFADRDAYAGADGEDPIYEAIRSLVNRLRAAGIRWWMHIEET